MHSVQVIRSESEAKVLTDPLRREILRLLSPKPLTGGHLAKLLGITPPSASHHLRVLKERGFVSVARREEGGHGMVRTLYRPSAQMYVIDKSRLPLSIVRYFTPNHVERIRGILAALDLVREGFRLPSSEIEKAAWSFSLCLIDIAQKHVEVDPGEDPEFFINRLYKEALQKMVRSSTWVFPRLPNL